MLHRTIIPKDVESRVDLCRTASLIIWILWSTETHVNKKSQVIKGSCGFYLPISYYDKLRLRWVHTNMAAYKAAARIMPSRFANFRLLKKAQSKAKKVIFVQKEPWIYAHNYSMGKKKLRIPFYASSLR